MKIFIDESGGFGWNPGGVSVFCGVTIADRELPECTQRFLHWKQRIGCPKGAEVKGGLLSAQEQASFVQSVVLETQNFWITLVGTNTQTYRREMVERFREQLVQVLQAGVSLVAREGNTFLSREYAELSGWMRNRSPENIVWIETLASTIYAGLQYSIARFRRAEFDSEFEDLGILIDRSFIKEKRHIEFWHEFLRNRLYNISTRRPLITPRQWNERGHPFSRKFSKGDGLLVTTDLFRHGMRFEDSKVSSGLQFADICANAAFRFHSHSPKYRAYRLMRNRIVAARGQRPLHLIGFSEDSLWKDAPENHAKAWSMEEEHAKRQRAEFVEKDFPASSP